MFRLVLEPHGDPPRTRVATERLQVDGNPLFDFKEGEVHLYNDRFQEKARYPFDWYRSAFATTLPGKDDLLLASFRAWLSNLFCFRINPFRDLQSRRG